jgi:hypothetical protein
MIELGPHGNAVLPAPRRSSKTSSSGARKLLSVDVQENDIQAPVQTQKKLEKVLYFQLQLPSLSDRR